MITSATAEPKAFWTRLEVATYLGVTIDTVRRWAREGKIRNEGRLGGKCIYDPHEIKKLAGPWKNS